MASGDPTRSSTIAEASTITSSGMALELVLGCGHGRCDGAVFDSERAHRTDLVEPVIATVGRQGAAQCLLGEVGNAQTGRSGFCGELVGDDAAAAASRERLIRQLRQLP